jgi:hypothetical protein
LDCPEFGRGYSCLKFRISTPPASASVDGQGAGDKAENVA